MNGLRVRGLGEITIGDLDRDPTLHAAWNDVATQLRAENASPADIIAAKNAFTESYNEVTHVSGVSGDNILAAAKDYTVASRTVLGAIDHVDGLVHAAQSGVLPGTVVQLFTGTLIGALGLAGVTLSAGVGAAILVGASLVSEVLNALFAPGKGQDICGLKWDPPPDFVVGCLGMYGPKIVSAADPYSGWRSFPAPAHDAVLPGIGAWLEPSPSLGGRRPVDVAFPVYHQLECEAEKSYALKGTRIQELGLVRGAAVAQFLAMFASAWKSNAERAINGQNAAPDWQVLVQSVRLWNRAHEPGDPFEFARAVPKDALTSQEACPDELVPYVATLTDTVHQNLTGATDVQEIAPNGLIRIHTGPQKTIKRLLPPPAPLPGHGGSGPIGLPPVPGSRGRSSSGLVVGTLVVAGAALAGLAAYARTHGLTLTQAAQRLFGRT